MKIILDPALALRLLAYAAATHREYSGLGFCERRGEDIYVYDFALLDVGSFAYTEIDPKKIISLLDRPDAKNLKVWLHMHPLGRGIPGSENWSGRDEQTIRYEPLGSSPQLVKWSVSIVLTPRGWVGRIDNYVRGITQHLEVEPPVYEYYTQIQELEAAFQSRLRQFPARENEADEDTWPDDCDGQCDTCTLECEYSLPEEERLLAPPVDHPTIPGFAQDWQGRENEPHSEEKG